MGIIEMIFLGMGLAMDASAVSMTNGLNDKKMRLLKMIIIALFFGLFQGIMPLIGFFVADGTISHIVKKFAPYIALVLLSVLGMKMIIEAIKDSREIKEIDSLEESKPLTLKVLFLQSIATSIDALSVGLVFVDYGMKTAIIASSIIAVVTFIFSLFSIFIGKRFGDILKSKAALTGGIILVTIGIIIFFKGII